MIEETKVLLSEAFLYCEIVERGRAATRKKKARADGGSRVVVATPGGKERPLKEALFHFDAHLLTLHFLFSNSKAVAFSDQ